MYISLGISLEKIMLSEKLYKDMNIMYATITVFTNTCKDCMEDSHKLQVNGGYRK